MMFSSVIFLLAIRNIFYTCVIFFRQLLSQIYKFDFICYITLMHWQVTLVEKNSTSTHE